MSKISRVYEALRVGEAKIGESCFPGMVLGSCIVFVPEWNDGMMLWGDIWVVQLGPVLLAYNNMGRLRLFLSASAAADWVAEV